MLYTDTAEKELRGASGQCSVKHALAMSLEADLPLVELSDVTAAPADTLILACVKERL